jgi:hypothetical protein
VVVLTLKVFSNMGLRLPFMSNNLEHMVGVVASLLAIDYVRKM